MTGYRWIFNCPICCKIVKLFFPEKDSFSSCHECGTKKNSESPYGVELQTIGFRAPMMLYHLAVSEVYYEVHMKRVLHTARISYVDGVMFLNRTREIFFVPCSRQDKKHLSLFLYRAQNLLSLLFYYFSFPTYITKIQQCSTRIIFESVIS